MLVVAVTVGVAIGAVLGALGGGGSVLTVPAFVYLLGESAHSATTVSLFVVGATAMFGTLAHLRARRVRLVEGIVFGGLGIAGSVVGSRLSAGIPSSALLVAFSVLMLVAAVAMVLRSRSASPTPDREAVALVRAAGDGPVLEGALASASVGALSGAIRSDATGPAAGGSGSVGSGSVGSGSSTGQLRLGEDVDLEHDHQPGSEGLRRSFPVVLLTATAMGLLTGFFGVGGGFVVVPALVLVLGFDMPTAVGTSLLVIAINSAAALVARVGTPVHVDWAVLGAFTVAAIGGSLVGSKLTSVIRPQRLATSFTVLLVLVAVYTLARTLSHV